jgi:hypothetical protein
MTTMTLFSSAYLSVHLPYKQKLMKCQYLKPDNSNCLANAITDSDFCFSHNPDTKADKEFAVWKGGKAPKPRQGALQMEPIQIKAIPDLLRLIEDTINRVRTEPMTHQKANCIGYLANIALRTLESGQLADKLDLINSIVVGRDSKKI